MFSTYDLKSFGQRIRQIRLDNRLTQKAIYELTHINKDTLRKIENGLVIPKFETLEILSPVLKADLLNILRFYRVSTSINDLYNDIDNFILSNNISEIENLAKIIMTNLDEYNNVINPIDLELFVVFINMTVAYHKKETDRSTMDLICDALRKTNPSFCIRTLADFNYTEIEIRLLILVGLIYVDLGEIDESNKIFIFCYDQLTRDDYYGINSLKVKLKILLNISYNCFRLNKYEESISYCDKGIQLAMVNHSSYCLPHIFARKGVSEFRLGHTGYLKTLKKAINLFEILEMDSLAKQYKAILASRYNIIIDES